MPQTGETPPDPGELAGSELSFSARSIILSLRKSNRNPFASMITIGRGPNNDVILPCPTVTKFHAYVIRLEDGWVIYDQRSTNRTFLDEVPIGSGGFAHLADGAHLGFGPHVRAIFFSPRGAFRFIREHRADVRAQRSVRRARHSSSYPVWSRSVVTGLAETRESE